MKTADEIANENRQAEEFLADQRKSSASSQPCANTDREIWREREGDYYADSIHVTLQGGIGINCGGTVYVKPVREWHKLAGGARSLRSEIAAPTVEHDNKCERLVLTAASPTCSCWYRRENAELRAHLDRLTGMKFSDRMHAALVSRAETAERQRDEALKDAESFNQRLSEAIGKLEMEVIALKEKSNG